MFHLNIRSDADLDFWFEVRCNSLIIRGRGLRTDFLTTVNLAQITDGLLPDTPCPYTANDDCHRCSPPQLHDNIRLPLVGAVSARAPVYRIARTRVKIPAGIRRGTHASPSVQGRCRTRNACLASVQSQDRERKDHALMHDPRSPPSVASRHLVRPKPTGRGITPRPASSTAPIDGRGHRAHRYGHCNCRLAWSLSAETSNWLTPMRTRNSVCASSAGTCSCKRSGLVGVSGSTFVPSGQSEGR